MSDQLGNLPAWAKWLKLAADFGTALAGFAALAAIALSIYTYEVTMAHQVQQEVESRSAQGDQTAVQLYRSYLQLILEKPASFEDKKNRQAAEFVTTTAEAILDATNEPGWRETTKQMLENNRGLIEAGEWNCSAMNQKFVGLARDEMKLKLKCVK